MTEKDYLDDQLSIARNPIIANVFLRLELIEKLGTGVQRINAQYQNSINKPVYYITENLIRVTLPLLGSTTPHTTQTTQTLTDKMTDMTDKMTDKERRNIVIKLINDNGYITNSMVRDKMQFSEATVKRLLHDMVTDGILRVEGENKGTKYYLKN